MKFRVLTEEEALAVAHIFKDLEDDMLDFVLDEIKSNSTQLNWSWD